MLSVEIDRSACIGCAFCAEACADVFGMDTDNIAIVAREPDGDNADCAMNAAIGCPTNAIYFH